MRCDGNQLYFITATDRPTRLLDSPRFGNQFVEALNRLRSELRFLSLWELSEASALSCADLAERDGQPSRIVGSLKQPNPSLGAERQEVRCTPCMKPESGGVGKRPH